MDSLLHSAQSGIHIGFGGMNALDWTIAMVLAISTVTAFMRGFIRSLIALLGSVAGITAACLYTQRAAAWLLRYIQPIALAQVVAFIGILTGVYVVAAILGRVLHGAATAVGLGIFNRFAGAAFGFARASLLIAALLIPMIPWLPYVTEASSSKLLPYFLPTAHTISFVMPRDFGMRVSVQRWLAQAIATTPETTSPEPRKTPSNLR